MSDTGTDGRNLEVEAPSIRGHIESAVIEHAPHHSTVGPLVDRAVEEHAREIKKQNETATPADRKDKLRATIRASIDQVRHKAATTPPTAPTSPLAPQESAKGPPIHWTDEAKAGWNNLPYSVRADVLREQNSLMANVLPRLKAHAEIEQAIAPHRDIIPKHISEPAAVSELFNWYRALNSPHRAQAFAVLMQQTGTSLQDIANLAHAQPQPQHYESDPAAVQTRLAAFAQDKPAFESVRYDMGRLLQQNPHGYNGADGQVDLDRLYAAAIQQRQSPGSGPEVQVAETIRKFSQGKHFFPAVRNSMGLLLSAHPERYGKPDGSCDLDKLYADAMKAEGVSDTKRSKRDAAVSPSSRSPSAPLVDSKKAVGVRASIKRAIAESRGII